MSSKLPETTAARLSHPDLWGTKSRPVVRRLRVMAVASGGGHWVQLQKLAGAFGSHDVVYVTVNRDYREGVAGARFYAVGDANMWGKVKLARLAVRVLLVILRERPDVVISTGAAPGFFAIFWAKLLLQSRTIWVDSIANSGTLSSSGKHAGRFSDLWLTQWEQLSRPEGPTYGGRIL